MSRALSAVLLGLLACTPASVEPRGGFQMEAGRLDCEQGSLCAPDSIDIIPFHTEADLAKSPSHLRGNSCVPEALPGHDRVYEVEFVVPGEVAVQLEADDGVQAFMFDPSDDHACMGFGTDFRAPVGPATYLIVVDSDARDLDERPFTLKVDLDSDVLPDDQNEPNDVPGDATEVDPGWTEMTYRGTVNRDSPVDFIDIQLPWVPNLIELGGVVTPHVDVYIHDAEPASLMMARSSGQWFWNVESDGEEVFNVLVEVRLNEASDVDWADYSFGIGIYDMRDDWWD